MTEYSECVKCGSISAVGRPCARCAEIAGHGFGGERAERLKAISVVLLVVGVIMAAIGLIKGYVIGYYPEESWWTHGLAIIGLLLAALGWRMLSNLVEDDEEGEEE